MAKLYDSDGKFLRDGENPYSPAALQRALSKRQPERKNMSDDEIEKAAQAEWLGVLIEMWDAIGKEATSDRLGVYKRQLNNIPLSLLRLGVGRAIRENGNYQVVPTVGAVWDAVKKELKNPHDLDQALEMWKANEWRRVVLMENTNVALGNEPDMVFALAAYDVFEQVTA